MSFCRAVRFAPLPIRSLTYLPVALLAQGYRPEKDGSTARPRAPDSPVAGGHAADPQSHSAGNRVGVRGLDRVPERQLLPRPCAAITDAVMDAGRDGAGGEWAPVFLFIYFALSCYCGILVMLFILTILEGFLVLVDCFCVPLRRYLRSRWRGIMRRVEWIIIGASEGSTGQTADALEMTHPDATGGTA